MWWENAVRINVRGCSLYSCLNLQTTQNTRTYICRTTKNVDHNWKFLLRFFKARRLTGEPSKANIASFAHIVPPRTRMVSPRSRSNNRKEIFPSWKNISPFHWPVQSEKKTRVNSQRCMARTNVVQCRENVTCCYFHWEPSEKRGLKMFIEKLRLWFCFYLQHLIYWEGRVRFVLKQIKRCWKHLRVEQNPWNIVAKLYRQKVPLAKLRTQIRKY